MPDLLSEYGTRESKIWLGRLHSLLEAAGQHADAISVSVASDTLGGAITEIGVRKIEMAAYRLLATAERSAPAAARGAFIRAGAAFTAMQAVAKVVETVTSDVMFLDPYADTKLLNDFAVLVPEGMPIRVLADASTKKPTLEPAAKAWRTQFGSHRPLEIRLAQPRTLHDRAIFVDHHWVWTLGQSFNALGTRSHTVIVRVDDPDAAELKRKAYEDIWSSSNPLV